jgi:hypothetical protein
MIADAVKAAYPEAKHISVDIQTIRFSLPEKGIRCTYLTPRTAQIALLNFDQGQAPAPFRFVLRGGQVTKTRRHAHGNGERSPAQQEALEKAAAASTTARRGNDTVIPQEEERKGRGRARLTYGHGEGPSHGGVPGIRGGGVPPVGMLAGGSLAGKIPTARRRAYGLRAMDRAK